MTKEQILERLRETTLEEEYNIIEKYAKWKIKELPDEIYNLVNDWFAFRLWYLAWHIDR